MKKTILLLGVILVSSLAYSAPVKIREWLFNEPSGGLAFDTVAFDTLTLTGITQGVAGRTDSGIQTIHYSDKAVPTAVGFGLNGLSAYTVMFDMYLPYLSTNPIVGIIQFMENWNGVNRNIIFNYTPDNGAYPDWNWNCVTGSALEYNFILSSGVWYNVAIVFQKNDANGQKLYITALPGTVGSPKASRATADTNVPNATGTGWYFQSYELNRAGLVIWDNLRVYNTANSQAEIEAIVNPPAPPSNTYRQNTRIIIH